MAQQARRRETLLMEQVLKEHPWFEHSRGQVVRIEPEHSIEGGDMLVAGPDTLLVGVSERTGFSGLMQVAESLLSPCADGQEGGGPTAPDAPIRTIIAVDIPKQRSSMHLDTLFTFASPNECVVFEPAILHRRNNVFSLSRKSSGITIRPLPDLKTALEEACGRPFTFIPCGGGDLTRQYREQWTDGANLLALAPGVVIGYERNTHTFKAMADHGYRVMNQFEFVEMCAQTPFNPADHGKLAISFQGHELCRGRGGARCMTLPLRRLGGGVA
jgi:arginine deiminase